MDMVSQRRHREVSDPKGGPGAENGPAVEKRLDSESRKERHSCI